MIHTPPLAEQYPLLATARSFLFVPANRPDRYAKALASGANAIIIDLEDAVAITEKLLARQHLADGFGKFSTEERSRVVVRINASATAWHEDDLTLVVSLASQGLSGVMVPKAETLAGLERVAQALGPTCALLPQIESVAGLDAATDLAAAPQVLRLVFGNLDFQADLGLACGPNEEELLPVRLAIVMAARRAKGCAPVDGVTPDTQDSTQLQADVTRSRRSGFTAKLCIHPAQVALVNAAFTPSVSELAWAQRVLLAYQASGGGVVTVDGRMVDAPVVRVAQRIVRQAQPNSTHRKVNE
jgi:citrate lyase subunit beta/citryl-CoA lyase